MYGGEKQHLFFMKGEKIQVKSPFKLIHLLDRLNLNLMKGHQRCHKIPGWGFSRGLPGLGSETVTQN